MMASCGEDGNTPQNESNTASFRNNGRTRREKDPAESTSEKVFTQQDGSNAQIRSKKSQGEYLPLIKFLFTKGEEQVQKEVLCLLSGKTDHIRDSTSKASVVVLSDQAQRLLKDKILAHPFEAASLIQQIVPGQKKISIVESKLPDVKNKLLTTNLKLNQKKNKEVEKSFMSSESKLNDKLNVDNQNINNQMDCIFIEALDHCLRRVKNLQEKEKRLEHESQSFEGKLTLSTSPSSPSNMTRSPSVRSKYSHSPSQKFSVKNKEAMESTISEKLRNETLFYKVLAVSSVVSIGALSVLFPRILKLCWEDRVLNLRKVYGCMLVCSEECLALFCCKEEEYLKDSLDNSHIDRKTLVRLSDIDNSYIFANCSKFNKHILQMLYEKLLAKSSMSLSEIGDDDDDSSWLLPLWPLVFLESWASSEDKVDSLIKMTQYWENQPDNIEPLLLRVMETLNLDLSLVRWCLAHYNNVVAAPLLQLVRSHSPLYILQRALPLHTLWPEEVIQILQEQCLAREPSGALSGSCISTYQAYCIMLNLLQALGTGMQLDNAVAGRLARDNQKHTAEHKSSAHKGKTREILINLYQQSVVEKLKEVLRQLNELHPVEYRVEIMENIFSVLFICHNDVSDETFSESGGEEGEIEKSTFSQPTDPESLASTPLKDSSFIPGLENKKRKQSSSKSLNSVSKGKKVLDLNNQAVFEESYSGLVNLSIKEISNSNASSTNNVEPGSSPCSSREVREETDALSGTKVSSGRVVDIWEVAPPSPVSGAPTAALTLQHQSSCTMSGRSTSSSAVELPRTGYLVNTLVAWDVLLLLRDALLAASAHTFSNNNQNETSRCRNISSLRCSISKEKLQSHLSSLSRCVSEALWRIQVVSPCNRKLGSLVEFDDFLDNKLLAQTNKSYIYQVPNITEVCQQSSRGSFSSSSISTKRKLVKDNDGVDVLLLEQQSIINYLLAPPSSLISVALTNGYLTQAEQVLKMYDITDSGDKKEVELASALALLRPKLSISEQRAGKNKPIKPNVKSSVPSHDLIKNIGLLARDGSAQVGTTNLIHDLVTSSPPPVPPGISQVSQESGCHVILSFLSPQSLVMADLALTVDMRDTTASYLLEQAIQKHSSNIPTVSTTSSSSSSAFLGYVALLQTMARTISVIKDLDEESSTLDKRVYTDKKPSGLNTLITQTPISLLLSYLPIDEVKIKCHSKGWKRIYQCLYDLQESLQCDINLSDLGSTNRRSIIHSRKNKAHSFYKGLLKALTEEVQIFGSSSLRGRGSGRFGAYVRTFYLYVQLLSTMVTQYAKEQFLEGLTSYFSLLSHRPVHILGSLMFLDGVDPAKLEPLAARMRLNLTTIIIKYCCPNIRFPYSVAHMMKENTSASHAGYQILKDRVIMNSGGVGCRTGVYGEVVVRDILAALLNGLRETLLPISLASKTHKALVVNDKTSIYALESHDVITALLDTADLASIDFDKLESGNEALVFFVNLANLMYLHAGLLNHILYPSNVKAHEFRGLFSIYPLERIMTMKRLGYNVGSFGFLSLYDILYVVLQQNHPLDSIVYNSESNKIFNFNNNPLHYLKNENIDQFTKLVYNISSKLTFCLNQGSPVSPRIQVMYADRLEEQIDASVQEHINLFFTVNDLRKLRKISTSSVVTLNKSMDPAKVLIVSKTILNYLTQYGEDILRGLQSLTCEAMDIMEESALKVFQSYPLKIELLDSREKRGISLEYMEDFDDGDCASIGPESVITYHCEGLDPRLWVSVHVPSSVVKHLDHQCPLLAHLVQVLHTSYATQQETHQQPKDNLSKPKKWPKTHSPPTTSGSGTSTQRVDTFRTTTNLFASSRHQALATLSQGSKVLSALSFHPEVSEIWKFINKLLNCGNVGGVMEATVAEEFRASLLSRIPSVIGVLAALPSAVLRQFPDLQVLLNSLLAQLVHEQQRNDDILPWLCVRLISDSCLRYKVLMDCHREWPASHVVSLLKLVEADCNLPTDFRQEAQERAVRVELYNKILGVGLSSIEGWQGVEDMSSSDPAALLHTLLEKKQFKMGVEWAEHHTVSSHLRRLVDQSYLMAILDNPTPNYSAATSSLLTVDQQDLLSVAQSLLKRIIAPQTRRFIIEFLLSTGSWDQETVENDLQNNSENIMSYRDGKNKNKTSIVNQDTLVEECQEAQPEKNCLVETQISVREINATTINFKELRQEVMGLILVEDVSQAGRERFSLCHLATAPHFIIEQWFMNVKLEALEKAIKVLAPHLDEIGPRTIDSQNKSKKIKEENVFSWNVLNKLVETYAAKAVETTGVQLSLKPHPLVERSPKTFVMPPQPPDREQWTPDADVTVCPVCKIQSFSLFSRRHHCRRCGRVVCNSCSQARMIVQCYGNFPVRVCLECNQQTKDLNLQDYIQVRPLGDGTYDAISEQGSGGSQTPSSARGNSSFSSETEGGWYLTTDQHHNSLVRQEFCYDYAPSISLSLAILSLHQDAKRAAICIFKLSHNLFTLIVSTVKHPIPEVDHSFVLSMIQTLLASSKVRFGNIGCSVGISLCEYCTQWVELLRLLLEANCGGVVTSAALENMMFLGDLQRRYLEDEEEHLQPQIEKCLQHELRHMRLLRDTLVKEQLWELALNVSTKAGLESQGVWGAWAMASLKGGDFAGARERFSRILERPRDRNQPCRSSLLPEILKYLESVPFNVEQSVMDQAERTRATLMMNDQTRQPPCQALVVMHALHDLTNIANGSLRTNNKEGNKLSISAQQQHQRSRRRNSRQQTLFYNECKYYLRLYGNHSLTLKYFMRQRQLHECVEYLHQEEVDVEVFVKEVLVLVFRNGHLEHLLRALSAVDPQQKQWGRYLLGGCRWLERNGWWNCLLTLQEALNDSLRAAMTLLLMYCHNIDSFSGLCQRGHLLTTAKAHLQAYLDTQMQNNPASNVSKHSSSSSSSSTSTSKEGGLLLHMSPWQVNQHINTLSLQTDSVKFLASCEVQSGGTLASIVQNLRNMKVLKTPKFPTLLGEEPERLAIATLLVCGGQVITEGLDTAYRVVESCGVSARKLLSVSCQILAATGRHPGVCQAVRGMQEWALLKPAAVDAALRPTIVHTAKSGQSACLDSLIKLLSDDSCRISVYMECGRLKSAYLVAVHRGNHEDVVKIKAAAEAGGQAHMVTMCTKWLQQYQARTSHR